MAGSKHKGALDTILQQDEELKSLRYILSEVHATAKKAKKWHARTHRKRRECIWRNNFSY